jgi:hypothetical protein
MWNDRLHHKKQRFTPENHLVMDGPRQTSKQRQRRLERFLSRFTSAQLAAQAQRHYEKAGRRYRLMAWGI